MASSIVFGVTFGAFCQKAPKESFNFPSPKADFNGMSLRKYKLGFRNKSIEQQLTICSKFIAAVATVPPEKRPRVDVQNLKVRRTNAERLTRKLAELENQTRMVREQLHREVKELRDEVTRGACNVWLAATEEADILRAGLSFAAGRRLVGRPGVPEYFRAVPTPHKGAVALRWKRLLRRCVALVEYATRPEADAEWKRAGTAFKSKILVMRLRSGRQYWFRLALVNAHGQGPWTNPVAARAA